MTPATRHAWATYEAANRRARIDYWRRHHCPECGAITEQHHNRLSGRLCGRCAK